MKSKQNENSSKITPTKAMYNLTESFEMQSKRISAMEQQFMELASRVSHIEGPKHNTRSPR